MKCHTEAKGRIDQGNGCPAVVISLKGVEENLFGVTILRFFHLNVGSESLPGILVTRLDSE